MRGSSLEYRVQKEEKRAVTDPYRKSVADHEAVSRQAEEIREKRCQESTKQREKEQIEFHSA